MAAVYLPEELIREILLRLPVKSLLKFRCVSKSWLSLISSHQFSMAHLNVSSKKNDTLIFSSKVKNLYTCFVSSVSELTTDVVYSVDDENPVYNKLLDYPFTGIDGFRWIVGSCNGLVCLLFNSGDIILWNSALKKFKKLPYSGTHFNGYGRGICHGFGYDKVHDDYKVVEFSHPDQVKVYSRRSNSWKVLGNWPGGDACCWPGQFLNGAIHWCVLDLRSSPTWIIVAQDVVSDKFVKLPLPTLKDFNVVVKVEILDGCLAFCCWYYNYMVMWVMKEYGLGESWIKQLRIPCSPDLYWDAPLLIFGDGKILIEYGMSLRIYDSTNPQASHRFSTRYIDVEEVTVTSYFESLVSPNLDEDDCVSTIKVK